MAYSKLPYQTRMALSLEYDMTGLIMCLNLSIRKLTEGTWWLFLLPIIISPYTACPPCLPSILLPHFFFVSFFSARLRCLFNILHLAFVVFED